MKTKSLVTSSLIRVLLFDLCSSPLAQLPKETEAHKAERLKWWTDSRFWMFIHWGLYALTPGGGRAGLIQCTTRIDNTNGRYQKLPSLSIAVQPSEARCGILGGPYKSSPKALGDIQHDLCGLERWQKKLPSNCTQLLLVCLLTANQSNRNIP